MNTQTQNEMNVRNHKRPALKTAISELVGYIHDAKIELRALRAARQEAAASRDSKRVARATLNLQQRQLAHFELVQALKVSLIKRAVERRLSRVTPCQFQMMIDGVPFYKFSDLETGVSFEGIAYGTEANRIMYQLKADLERAVKQAIGQELTEVNAALESWKGALRAVEASSDLSQAAAS